MDQPPSHENRARSPYELQNDTVKTLSGPEEDQQDAAHAAEQKASRKIRVANWFWRNVRRRLESRAIEVLCAIAIVGITFVYTYYAKKQTGAAITAANAAKDAATAAKTSADAATRQLTDFEQAQGAALSTEVSFTSDETEFSVAIINHGQIAAKNVVVCGTAGIILPTVPPASRHFRLLGDNSYIPPGAQPYPAGTIQTPGADTIDHLKTNPGFFYVERSIAFDPGFKNQPRVYYPTCTQFQMGHWEPCRGMYDNEADFKRAPELQIIPPAILEAWLKSLPPVPKECK